MSSLVTNPTSQFINPFFGNPCENAKIFIGKVNTDAMAAGNRQDVYLMQWTDESTLNKVALPQPLLTNSAGVIVYQGLPVTPWVDESYSITIIGYSGEVLYQSFYVDDPTYWLRLDLATEPKKNDDGQHYDADDRHGVNLVAGAAPILSPDFQGNPTAPTPPAGDSDTSIATTAFVTAAVTTAISLGRPGSCEMWPSNTPPAGAVVRDGSQLNKETYPEAYAVLGDTYAIANGLVPDSASFMVPDQRGRYERGADNGAGRSSYAAMLTTYPDMFKAHSHGLRSRGPSDVSTGSSSMDDQIPSPSNAVGINTESTGGAETMPMTVAYLPIIWVQSQGSSVSLWYEQENYKSTRPAVHHYHPDSGKYTGSSLAHPSPSEPGVWLTPAHATTEVPPASKPGHIVVWSGGAWRHDAEAFERVEQQKAEARQTRERENTELMARNNNRRALNEWMKATGAPFTLDDI